MPLAKGVVPQKRYYRLCDLLACPTCENDLSCQQCRRDVVDWPHGSPRDITPEFRAMWEPYKDQIMDWPKVSNGKV